MPDHYSYGTKYDYYNQKYCGGGGADMSNGFGNHNNNHKKSSASSAAGVGAYHVPMPARVYNNSELQATIDRHRSKKAGNRRSCLDKLKLAMYMCAIGFLVLVLLAILLGFVMMLLDDGRAIRRRLSALHFGSSSHSASSTGSGQNEGGVHS